MPKVRIGVYLPQIGVDYRTLREVAVESERLGLDSVWATDHMLPYHGDLKRPYLECWTVISALAEVPRG